MEGSRTTHCVACCPPHPISERQVAELQSILSHKQPDTELDMWRYLLTCGHDRAGTVHSSYRTGFPGPVLGVMPCKECAVDRGVVSQELIGPLVSPETAEQRRASVDWQKETTAARREVAAKRNELAAAERRLKNLER